MADEQRETILVVAAGTSIIRPQVVDDQYQILMAAPGMRTTVRAPSAKQRLIVLDPTGVKADAALAPESYARLRRAFADAANGKSDSVIGSVLRSKSLDEDSSEAQTLRRFLPANGATTKPGK